MGHAITAIVLKGDYDKSKAKAYDLIEVDLGHGLSMFFIDGYYSCLLYTSPSPRDATLSRMPSSA